MASLHNRTLTMCKSQSPTGSWNAASWSHPRAAAVRRALGQALRPATWALLAALLAGGCGSAAPQESVSCVQALDRDCQPLYEPVFSELFERTLRPTCAQSAFCHSTEGAAGGLSMDDEDVAFELLLAEGGGGPPRVVPDDPECSLLVRRIESRDEDDVMPPGRALSAPERCVVVRWIASGARR